MPNYDLYAQLHNAMRIRVHDAVHMAIRSPNAHKALDRMARRDDGPWLQFWDMYWDTIRGNKIVLCPDLVREYVYGA